MAGPASTTAPPKGVKPGIKTTEFWVTVGTIGAGVAGILPFTLPGWAVAAIAAAYAIARGLAKNGTVEE